MCLIGQRIPLIFGREKMPKLIPITICTLLLAVGLFSGKLLAFSSSFSTVKVTLGDRIFHVRPQSQKVRKGSKLGLPLFEMRDVLVLNISYKCAPEGAGQLELRKDAELVGSSEIFTSGGKCFVNFGSSSKMNGEADLRFRIGDDVYESQIQLKRNVTVFSPMWEMIGSA
jgi:hypothetical protein